MPRILKGSIKGPIDVKRFYLPGVEVEDDCPKCGSIWTFNVDYVSYPTAGDNIDLHAYCQNCENEWSVRVQLQVTITL